MVGVVIIPFLAALSAAEIEQIIKYDDTRVQRTAEAKTEARITFRGSSLDSFVKIFGEEVACAARKKIAPAVFRGETD